MSNESFFQQLKASRRIHIKQVFETLEIIVGWETRNKYQVYNEQNKLIGFAAEKSDGLAGTIKRGILKHWRKFDILIFDENQQKILTLHFPFRWFLKSLTVTSAENEVIGTIQQRWSFLYKKFDLMDKNGRVLCRIRTSFFRMWTFEFKRGTKKIGTLQKKWDGIISETFTDKDNFTLSFADPSLDEPTKTLMMSLTLMVDILYFENNKGINFIDT